MRNRIRTVHFAQVISWKKKNCFKQRMQCCIAARRCLSVPRTSFRKKQRASQVSFWQEVNEDMTGIPYRRFGSSIIKFPDLENLRRDRCLYTHASRETWSDFTIYWGSDDGCGLIHAINTTDGFILDDRCIRDYCLWHKRRNWSFERVTLAKTREL